MIAEEYRALLAVDFEDVESGGLTDISKLSICLLYTSPSPRDS